MAETVTALGFDARYAELEESIKTTRDKLREDAFRRIPDAADTAQNPAAGGGYFEIGFPPAALYRFPLARVYKQRVRMGVNKPGRHQTTAGVDNAPIISLGGWRAQYRRS